MTRMTGSDCAVMCNLIKTHTHTHTHAHTQEDTLMLDYADARRLGGRTHKQKESISLR